MEIEGRLASFILMYYLPFIKHFAKQSALYPFYYLFSSSSYTRPMRQHSPKDRKTKTVIDKKKSLPCLYCTLVEMWHALWQSWDRNHWKLNSSPCYDLLLPHYPKGLNVSPVIE